MENNDNTSDHCSIIPFSTQYKRVFTMRKWSNCPVCDSFNCGVLYVNSNVIPGEVVKCKNCSMLYKIPYDNNYQLHAFYKRGGDRDYAESEEFVDKEFFEIKSIIKKHANGKIHKILDIGCYKGRFIKSWDSKKYEMQGVELNEYASKIARTATAAKIINSDAMLINFKPESFDVITMLDFIEHIQDPLKLLKKYHKYLKKTGILVIHTPNHSGIIIKLCRFVYSFTMGIVKKPCDEIFDTTHVLYFVPETLKEILTKAGFEVSRTEYMKFNPERRNRIKGFLAFYLRCIESSISRFIPKSRYRILMIARPVLLYEEVDNVC